MDSLGGRDCSRLATGFRSVGTTREGPDCKSARFAQSQLRARDNADSRDGRYRIRADDDTAAVSTGAAGLSGAQQWSSAKPARTGRNDRNAARRIADQPDSQPRADWRPILFDSGDLFAAGESAVGRHAPAFPPA